MTGGQAYSIRIFLPAGDPNGLRIFEKSNWSGCGLVVPRPLFGEARKRRELARTGVYVLVGPPEEAGLPRVYVGEADAIRTRLEQHESRKDFWTSAIVFTSKDDNLNAAHARYLEARLIGLAARAKRCILENGNRPQLPPLSEADTADAEGFLAEMLLSFPLLGLAMFAPALLESSSTQFVLKSGAIEAKGFETPGGFVVRARSQAVKSEQPSIHPYLKARRNALVENGVFEDAGATLLVTQDYPFDSPSMAAGVLLGRTANGRIEWKTADGRTLKAVQEAEAIG